MAEQMQEPEERSRTANRILSAIPQTRVAIQENKDNERAQQNAFSGVKAAVPQKVTQQATAAGVIITNVAGGFDKVIMKSENSEVVNTWKKSDLYNYLVRA